jgi:hypothetical protein
LIFSSFCGFLVFMKGLAFVKGVFGFTLLILAGMLYWSSLLQESDLKKVRQELKDHCTMKKF